MGIIHKIKLLLGLEKLPAPVHVATLLEQLQGQLQSVAPDQKAALLQTAQSAAEKQVGEFLQARGPVEHIPDPVAWQQFEVMVFVYQQLHPVTPGVADESYEHLLEKLVALFQVLAKPAAGTLSALEGYTQRFEEALLLHEASGTYSFAISENKKVIRFPFMRPKAVKAAYKEQAEQMLSQLFTESRELALLELDTHAPWVPISFLEITDLARTGSIACIKQAGAQEYYGFLS